MKSETTNTEIKSRPLFDITYWLCSIAIILIVCQCCVNIKPQGDGRILATPLPTNKVVGFNLEEGHRLISTYEDGGFLYIIEEVPDRTFMAWKYNSNGALIDNLNVNLTFITNNGNVTMFVNSNL